jgi:UDP-glucose/GDP-mannose dehydrogenase family, central domain
MRQTVVVVGLGEVGHPLLQLVERAGHTAVGVDLEPTALPAKGATDVLHVCFPFDVPDYVGETTRYVELLEPALTILNSTVAVGTTREVYERIGRSIAYSPVRGKHERMVEELLKYRKYVGGIDQDAASAAAAHFESLGMRTRVVPSPESAELAKLSETTYFGLLIAWAQEVERYCDLTGQSYDEVVSFYEEIAFLPPVKYTPGVIGGHCIMPNVDILGTLMDSDLLAAVKSSNELKKQRSAFRQRTPRLQAQAQAPAAPPVVGSVVGTLNDSSRRRERGPLRARAILSSVFTLRR